MQRTTTTIEEATRRYVAEGERGRRWTPVPASRGRNPRRTLLDDYDDPRR